MQKLQQMFPQDGPPNGYNFRGEAPMDMQQAMQAMAEMGQLNDMALRLKKLEKKSKLILKSILYYSLFLILNFLIQNLQEICKIPNSTPKPLGFWAHISGHF